MAELELKSSQKVAESIAYYTEGNLLASMQEIQKLKMAYPDGNIDTQDYLIQLNQQSQYTVYNLIDSPSTSKLILSSKPCIFAVFLMWVKLCSVNKSSGPKTK
jgi:DNA polymerase III delta subunit